MGAWRSLPGFKGQAQFSSWLFRIAHNKAVDMNRRQRPFAFLEQGQDQDQEGGEAAAQPQPWSGAPPASPEESLASEEQNLRVMAMLKALPWRQRLLVELKIYQSLTFEEIAEMQGISVNTAKTRFYSALRKMKSTMEQDYGMPADAADGRGLL